jgi:hypothetical protein
MGMTTVPGGTSAAPYEVWTYGSSGQSALADSDTPMCTRCGTLFGPFTTMSHRRVPLTSGRSRARMPSTPLRTSVERASSLVAVGKSARPAGAFGNAASSPVSETRVRMAGSWSQLSLRS